MRCLKEDNVCPFNTFRSKHVARVYCEMERQAGNSIQPLIKHLCTERKHLLTAQKWDKSSHFSFKIIFYLVSSLCVSAYNLKTKIISEVTLEQLL